MPQKPLTAGQLEHIRDAAVSAARVLANASDEEVDLLLTTELMPFAAMAVGLRLVAIDREWTDVQYYKAILYAILRQRRAVKESEDM